MAKTFEGVSLGALFMQPTVSGKWEMLESWTGKVGKAPVTRAQKHMPFSLIASGKEHRDIWDPVDVVQRVRDRLRVPIG